MSLGSGAASTHSGDVPRIPPYGQRSPGDSVGASFPGSIPSCVTACGCECRVFFLAAKCK